MSALPELDDLDEPARLALAPDPVLSAASIELLDHAVRVEAATVAAAALVRMRAILALLEGPGRDAYDARIAQLEAIVADAPR